MIAVVGLAFEARIIAGPGVRVVCSGDRRNLSQSLALAIDEVRAAKDGRLGLISFGVAGGLDPRLDPGTCIVGSTILSGTAIIDTDQPWSQRLLRMIPDAVYGPIVGVPAPITSREAKRILFQETGAVAVDMESHIVAATAVQHNIPLAAIRVVTDPAGRSLPACAVAAMRANGTADIAAMVRSVLRRPSELLALLRTMLDAYAARDALLRGRRLLGPHLGSAEIGTLELESC
jgi:hopanoid-associated phosphorylase